MPLHESLTCPPSPLCCQPQYGHPRPQSSIQTNTVDTNQLARNHVALQMCKKYRQEYLHNVYKLPSVKPTIWYLHGMASFPTKASWLKAIRK
jgi:hypothetical protein